MLTVSYKGRELQVAEGEFVTVYDDIYIFDCPVFSEYSDYCLHDIDVWPPPIRRLFACWQVHLWKVRLSESADDEQQMEAWSEIADEQDPAPEKTEGRKP